jgi:hypothetical protein
MPETPVKVVVDLSKPAGEREQIIPLTAEEIAQREADAQAAAEEQAQRDAEEAARQAAKTSAQSKLSALGLTTAEINALLGA